MSATRSPLLNTEQRDRLLVLRAAWEEGEDEERLERLRLREEDAELVRVFGQLLDTTGFAGGADLTYTQMTTLLGLVRALAPNPNLDARLLRRPGEPEQMNYDLRDLLFGSASVPLRLRSFLSRRHAGGQTAMQFLCALEPETWPLVTQAGLRALQLAPEQQQKALESARERFDLPLEIKGIESYSNRPIHVGFPDTDPILRLLADVLVYEEVCETLDASDYLAVHRLLTRGMALRPGRGRRAAATLLYSAVEGERRKVKGESGEEEEKRSRGEEEIVSHPGVHPQGRTQSAIGNRQSPIHNRIREPQGAEYEVEAAPAVVDIAGYTHSEVLIALEQEIAAQGFTYPPLIIRDYYLCLQSKPFVLLSGLSGTGKTRLTALFATALTGEQVGSFPTGTSTYLETPEHLNTRPPEHQTPNTKHPPYPDIQYRLLPVRPDWNDSAPLLGYVNLLAQTRTGQGTFVSTPFLDFLLHASRPANAHRAFFLCLDEMNLARVEHYFAEILSAMETPGRELLLPDGRVARLPTNLFLTGTLNLDEATHTLSRKVLDRANTISFQEVCLREEPDSAQTPRHIEGALPRLPSAMRQAVFLQARVPDVATAREKLRDVSPTNTDFAAQVMNLLADVNALLEPHGLHFAYRVRDEVLRYCANSFDVDRKGLLVPDAPDDLSRNLQTALDLQLTQKVLPRLTGTLEQLGTPVTELLRYAEQHRFEQTSRRLHRLHTRLQRDGFAGFDA